MLTVIKSRLLQMDLNWSTCCYPRLLSISRGERTPAFILRALLAIGCIFCSLKRASHVDLKNIWFLLWDLELSHIYLACECCTKCLIN